MQVYIDFAIHVIKTVITLILLPVSVLLPPTDGYEAKKPDELKTSFTVVSDIHIEGNNYQTFKEYSEILKEVRNAKHSDTLVFLGDNTMNGQHIESVFFFGGLKFAKPAKNLIIAPGNHDYGNGTGGYDELYKRFNSYINFAGCKTDTNNYYKVIDGYYFIVLSSESDSVNGIDISDAQLEWLKGVLDEASKENKPVFVFSHHPVNYIESGEYGRISDVLDDYANVLFFCGHTHFALSPYSVSTVNGVQSVNLPKATEHATEGYEPGIGAVVEVYENEVLLRFRDFDNGEWVEGYEYSFEY